MRAQNIGPYVKIANTFSTCWINNNTTLYLYSCELSYWNFLIGNVMHKKCLRKT